MYISKWEDHTAKSNDLEPELERQTRAFSNGSNSSQAEGTEGPNDSPRTQKRRGHPSGLPSPHPCTTCSMTFAHSAHLKAHERTHTGERPYDCSECGKRFAQIAHLKVPHRIHTGEKPYNCSVCGKRFAQLASLQDHQRRHTGEKSFSQLSNLIAHKTKHIGGVPYPWSDCGKVFSTAGSLKMHQRVHTGDKPFRCGFCFKCFTQLGNLKAHIERQKEGRDV